MAARTPSPAARMKSLQEHLVVPIDESADQRAQLVLAPNEPVRLLPFAFSYLRLTLYCVLAVCSCSLLVIVSIWFPQVFTRIARKRIPYSSLGEADYMLILVHGQGIRAQWVECPVHRPQANAKVPWLWFEFKKHRYVYNPERGEFERYLSTIREDLEHLQARTNVGLDDQAVASKSELYGPNRLFSAGVWFWEEYTIYAIVILVLSATSMAYEIYAEVSNSNRLRSLVLSDRLVDAVRSSKVTRIHETELVPGDLLEVTEGPMCADVLLLSGTCTADEASLTGEALPVNKEPAIGSGQVTEVSARSEYKASFLHAGSTITTVRGSGAGCKGVVLSTGFSTGKGELFRSILFPKPIVFEFERDSYRYLGVLWVVAIAAFIKRVAEGSTVGTPFGTTLVNSLDLITVAVPPALPLVLSSGIVSAQTLDTPSRFKLAMATCHGLSELEGKLQGYSLDVAMFDASKFSLKYLHDRSEGNYIAVVTASESEAVKYGILKRFPFDAACQRSSVVVEEIATGNRFVFVKGSPEAVSAICTNTPPDLKHKTLSYSADGYYCIGFGVKELSSKTHVDMNNREEVESAVEFEGLALFKNELKPETKGMLDELYAADIDIRVITGDNALTAVHVCRELEMKMKSKVAVVDVDEHSDSTVFVSVDDVKMSDLVQWTSFNSSNMEEVLAEYDVAITGAALDKLQRECGHDTVRRIIQQTLVFARYMVLYPIIQLGMASVLAQVGTWADVDVQLTDNQYLWDDLAVVLVLAMCMLYTGPSSKLSLEKPPKTLFSLPIVASILGQIAIYCAFYAAAIALMAHQDSWYCPIADALAFVNENDTSVSENCAIFVDYGVDDPDDLEFGYEDTVTWLFAHLSYLVVAIAFNIKDPFRLPFWTNRIYTVFITAEVGLNLWFLLDNSGALEDEFQVMPMPSSFRWSLFGLFVAELVIAIGWEMVATRTLPRWWKKRIAEKTNTRNSEKQSTTT
ncbi:hypothetical protein PRNP1_009771 [Phytophthora ramorum]